MSTGYYVDMNDLACEELHPALLYLEEDGRIQIGTSFGNADRKRALEGLIRERCGECKALDFVGKTTATIEELKSSDKPYCSKWDKESPIEFFNTIMRFSWAMPMGGTDEYETKEDADDEPEEDFAKAMLYFWDNLLEDSTPIISNSYPHVIDTWCDLKQAIFGDNRHMEPSKRVQGTFGRFTRPAAD